MRCTQSRAQQRTRSTSLRLFRRTDTGVVDATTIPAVTKVF